MVSQSPSRSLADDIRRRSDAELADLVLTRPDLARPAPADLTSLAARASTRASVQRAVDALDRGHMQVLEAVVVAEGGGAPTVDELLGVRGDDALAGTVATYVEDLWVRALLWRSPEGYRVVRTVPDVLGPVAGLGPPLREALPGTPVPTPEEIVARVAHASEAARAILDRLTWGPPVGVLPHSSAGATAARWLLERHLLATVAADRVALPREVGLALRGGRLHRESRLLPPDLPSRSVSARVADAVAGGAASELLSRVDELVDAWGAEPPRVLRAGGLSVRDLRATEELLDVPSASAAFVVEMSYAAGLVADGGDLAPVWAPTPEVDDWSSAEGGHRWAVLAGAWLPSLRAAHLVGERIGDSPANALGPDVQWPAIRALRREVLDELAALPPGHAADAAPVTERLLWRRPRRPAGPVTDAVVAVLREAEWLGVTGRGALSSAGRALVAEAPETEGAATAMSEHLPAPVDHILVQADLTAVAPGPLQGSLASFMRLAADVESRGGATVYRFTSDSIRRALDTGWTASGLLETVARASRTPVPQPLEYLVTDVARKHGVTRVGGSAAYVRSDDPSVLETMLATRELATLRLRRLAPTVLVSPADPQVLVELLRECGFAPALEGEAGDVLVAERAKRRARRSRRPTPPQVAPVDEPFTRSLVESLRVAEATADARRASEQARPGPAIPATDPVVTLALLRDAIADGHGVWIGVTDRLGATTRHLVHPRRIDGGRVHVTDESGHERSYSVHRITGATLDPAS